MKPTYRTKTVKESELGRNGISLSVYPSAGPRPNITGMKKQFWGMDACCIKVGSYVYKVPYQVWERF